METLSAPVDDQVKVLDCPAVIVAGFACASMVGSATGPAEEPLAVNEEIPRQPEKSGIKIARKTNHINRLLQDSIPPVLPLAIRADEWRSLPRWELWIRPAVLFFTSGRCQSSWSVLAQVDEGSVKLQNIRHQVVPERIDKAECLS